MLKVLDADLIITFLSLSLASFDSLIVQISHHLAFFAQVRTLCRHHHFIRLGARRLRMRLKRSHVRLAVAKSWELANIHSVRTIGQIIVPDKILLLD